LFSSLWPEKENNFEFGEIIKQRKQDLLTFASGRPSIASVIVCVFLMFPGFEELN